VVPAVALALSHWVCGSVLAPRGCLILWVGLVGLPRERGLCRVGSGGGTAMRVVPPGRDDTTAVLPPVQITALHCAVAPYVYIPALVFLGKTGVLPRSR